MKHLKWGMLVFVLATILTTVLTTMRVVGVSKAAAPNCGSWSVVASPSNGTNSNYLYSATAISPADVWAAGYYVNTQSQVNRTLVEHWNGTKWKVVGSFNYLTGSNALYGIAAASITNIWAVGYFTNNNVQRPLTEVWNGTSWNVVSSPNVAGSTSDILTSISVRSPTDIWAVGSYINSSGVTQTLIERWNGAKWNIVSSPNVGSGNNVLTGAAIISSGNVWAVGDYTNSSNVNQTLTEQWNGTSWNIVTSANVGTGSNVFSGVAVTSAPGVWAVGNYTNSGNVNQTLTESYC